MDFLGIGVFEVFVIIILGLIFIGPRDLPKLAGRFAKFLRDLRMMSEGFRTEWQREMQAATRIEGLKELREELIATRDTLREAGQDIKEAMTIDLEELEAEETETATAQVAADSDGGPVTVNRAADNPDDSSAEAEVDGSVTVEETPAKTNGSVTETAKSQPVTDKKSAGQESQSPAQNSETANPPLPTKPPKPAPAPAVQPPGLPEALQIDLEEFETRTIQPPVADNVSSDNNPVEAKDSD